MTGEELPLWVADYVLAGYGTGAVMAVPAHDERDLEFARAFDLPVKQVVAEAAEAAPLDFTDAETPALAEPGVVVNSGEGLDGLSTAVRPCGRTRLWRVGMGGVPWAGCRLASCLGLTVRRPIAWQDAKKAMIEKLKAAGAGESKISFKLRDWVFSRQRYWGEPIPIYFPVNMEDEAGDPRIGAAHTIDFDSPIAVDEADLPVALPDIDDFKPGSDPQGVLARVLDWRYFQKDGKWYARETNTMPQWAGSCWYYLRFADPANTEAAWSPEAEKSWLPVDLYVGGAEHAVLHLLYARFWHKVLYDLGLVRRGMRMQCAHGVHVRSLASLRVDPPPLWLTHAHTQVTTTEPFKKLVHQGMILGEDGEKMSKSRGNVVNPDDIVDAYGGDAMRMYEMFMGPLEAVRVHGAWACGAWARGAWASGWRTGRWCMDMWRLGQ